MLPDFAAFPTPPTPSSVIPSHEIWSSALTRPSVATFERLTNTLQATHSRAYKWVLLSALGSSTISVIVSLVRGLPWQWTNLAAILIFAVGALAAFILLAGVIQLLARALGGTGNYPKMAFGLAAFYAPMLMLAVIVFRSIFFLPLAVYWLALHLLAVKAVHQLSWGRAIVATLPVLLGVLFLVAGAVLVLVLALGQAAGSG